MEIQNLLNHFTFGQMSVLPASAFSRIETGVTDNGGPNDWLDIVFADDFDAIPFRQSDY